MWTPVRFGSKSLDRDYNNSDIGELCVGGIMGVDRVLCILLSGAMVAGSVFAQSNDKSSTGDQKRTIRVGISPTTNRSRRQLMPTWARDQLVRELQRLRADRKSPIVLEAVPLEAISQKDASDEADRKGCRYIVLTTLVDPSHGPGVSGGPDGVQRAPIILGNANSSQTLAIDFTVLEVGATGSLTQGTAAAPVEERYDVRAADEAMRLVAHRVASELRKDRAPSPD